jgi:hypothetical protein
MSGKKQPTPTVTYNGHKTREFTTSRGVTITISPAPPLANAVCKAALESDWLDSGRALPVKPTYEITTAAGVIEVHEHDPKSVVGNPEWERQWAEYEAKQKAFNSELNLQIMRVLVIGSVDFDVTPKMEAQIKAMRLKLPADAEERKFVIAQVLVFGSGEDFRSVIQISAELSGAPAQQVNAVREAFRGDAERSGDKAL